MNDSVVIALAGAILGAPFLNFVVTLIKRKPETANLIADGSSTTIQSMTTGLSGLRGELEEVRADRAEDRRIHREEIEAIRAEHRREVNALREEHRREVASIREEHRRAMADLEARLRADHG